MLLLIVIGGAHMSPGQSQSPESRFTPYTSCSLPDGPSVVETAPLAPGVTTRSVETIKGPIPVKMLDGRRVMFAYPGEDFYANVKVEILPADTWSEARNTLNENFDYLLASGENVRNYGLKPDLNGFSIEGQDRTKREGGVLGFYLLFDSATHAVVTIYFLNQQPPFKFTTMQEYGALRDRFLNGYTACVRKSLQSR
jgi:hypothetical protein